MSQKKQRCFMLLKTFKSSDNVETLCYRANVWLVDSLFHVSSSSDINLIRWWIKFLLYIYIYITKKLSRMGSAAIRRQSASRTTNRTKGAINLPGRERRGKLLDGSISEGCSYIYCHSRAQEQFLFQK